MAVVFTAIGGIDYDFPGLNFTTDFNFTLSSDQTMDNPYFNFTLSPSQRRCFNVTIINDSVLEDTELFSLNLTLAGGSTEDVEIVRDASVIEITDDDCKSMVTLLGKQNNIVLHYCKHSYSCRI